MAIQKVVDLGGYSPIWNLNMISSTILKFQSKPTEAVFINRYFNVCLAWTCV